MDAQPLADEFLDDGLEGGDGDVRGGEGEVGECQFAGLETAGEGAGVVAGWEGEVERHGGFGPEGVHFEGLLVACWGEVGVGPGHFAVAV